MSKPEIGYAAQTTENGEVWDLGAGWETYAHAALDLIKSGVDMSRVEIYLAKSDNNFQSWVDVT